MNPLENNIDYTVRADAMWLFSIFLKTLIKMHSFQRRPPYEKQAQVQWH